MTAKEGIAKAKKDMLARYPYFGSLAASLEYVETTAVRTMGNNGRTIYYNPGYIESLTDEERTFVLTHEVCHIAFDHIRRGKGKDPEIWKNATDAVVNQLLKRDGMKIISGGIDYPEAIDYDADAFYDILLEQKLEIELIDVQMEGDQTPGQETRYEEGDLILWDEDFDDETHELWDEDAMEEFDILALEKDIQAGDTTDSEERPLYDIGRSKPVIDWRYVLRDTANYDVDWSFTRAEIEDGLVRPMLDDRPLPEAEIVLDTSGSVSESLLRNFLRECKNILKVSRLKVGCFDTIFYGFQEIRTESDIDSMVFEGGGGTDFEAAVSAFSLRADNKIIFTDGCAAMPKEPVDAVWIVYGDAQIEPEKGRVIYITKEQLEKLSGKV